MCWAHVSCTFLIGFLSYNRRDFIGCQVVSVLVITRHHEAVLMRYEGRFFKVSPNFLNLPGPADQLLKPSLLNSLCHTDTNDYLYLYLYSSVSFFLWCSILFLPSFRCSHVLYMRIGILDVRLRLINGLKQVI